MLPDGFVFPAKISTKTFAGQFIHWLFSSALRKRKPLDCIFPHLASFAKLHRLKRHTDTSNALRSSQETSGKHSLYQKSSSCHRYESWTGTGSGWGNHNYASGLLACQNGWKCHQRKLANDGQTTRFHMWWKLQRAWHLWRITVHKVKHLSKMLGAEQLNGHAAFLLCAMCCFSIAFWPPAILSRSWLWFALSS